MMSPPVATVPWHSNIIFSEIQNVHVKHIICFFSQQEAFATLHFRTNLRFVTTIYSSGHIAVLMLSINPSSLLTSSH
jgi:hypothetical protein